MPTQVSEILSMYAYQVFFDGEPGAGFSDCAGLDGARQVGLQSGVLVTRAFFNWVMEHPAPHDLDLMQSGPDGQVLRRWRLTGARVRKVTATTFTGKGFPFRLESLELMVDGVVAFANLDNQQ